MLPDLIEIVPLSRRTDATVVLPGSKSLTNRALILAALASNPVVLRGALWSEDTQAMVNCLKRLGFCIEWRMIGPSRPTAPHGLRMRREDSQRRHAAQPLTLELFVENAGTAARFLPPFLCLGQGAYRRLCCPTRLGRSFRLGSVQGIDPTR
ncbi:hypothetical protein IVB18_33550 [Bradyrhizobium sp. 186]|uniref:hypothetical protein n=1 Tax=Bradyrhizobium sp. 186 TaxID=2782654 RepID=UPI002000A5BB|nr:hypothetical protein [Bradyrhizobium sp. 186]UPK33121.1 hypothetical protein IVB18_33550 [Bradyrhizobium sp. 186]